MEDHAGRGLCEVAFLTENRPEHEVIKGASHLLRQDGDHNTVRPHNQVSKGFPEEGVQPEAYCLGCVGAAQSFAKVQLELDLWRFPAKHQGKVTYSMGTVVVACYCVHHKC